MRAAAAALLGAAFVPLVQGQTGDDIVIPCPPGFEFRSRDGTCRDRSQRTPNIHSGDFWRFGPGDPICTDRADQSPLPDGVRYCHDLRGQSPGGGRGNFICGRLGCALESDACLSDGGEDCDPVCDDHLADVRGRMTRCPVDGGEPQPCYVPWTDSDSYGEKDACPPTVEDVRNARCVNACDDDGDDGFILSRLGEVLPGLIPVLVALLVINGVRLSYFQVEQREVIIIERFGKYRTTLTAGLNFIVPYIDRPKRYSEKYVLTDAVGRDEVKQNMDAIRVNTQDQVIDFPQQRAISRDNAIIELDAVLNFKILHPKIFIYSCVNLPNLISKLLQAQLRNVAGSLELDQMIQDAAQLNVLTGLLDMEAQRWGVQIQFVKVQRVVYSHNPQILSLVKDTENKNKEIIIDAKSTKQKAIIESEGQRDKMMKEAEGEANEMLANARGYAQAVKNKASGESRTIREVAKALRSAGATPRPPFDFLSFFWKLLSPPDFDSSFLLCKLLSMSGIDFDTPPAFLFL